MAKKFNKVDQPTTGAKKTKKAAPAPAQVDPEALAEAIGNPKDVDLTAENKLNLGKAPDARGKPGQPDDSGTGEGDGADHDEDAEE